MSIALLIARLVLGLGFAAHGAQKVFGWFGGHGIAGTGGFFQSMGFRPGVLFALAAGLGELGGGLLLALGLGGPIGPALMITVMIVAALSVHLHHGFFTANNGVEMPLLYASPALVFAFIGFGRYSLDNVLDLAWLTTARNGRIAVGAAVIAGLIVIALRRPASPAPGKPAAGS